MPEAGASKTAFPSWNSRRYTQIQASRKSRHFGRDAEIQAMDGSQSVVQMLVLGNLPTRSFPPWIQGHLSCLSVCHPWTLDFGIPAEMTGIQHLL